MCAVRIISVISFFILPLSSFGYFYFGTNPGIDSLALKVWNHSKSYDYSKADSVAGIVEQNCTKYAYPAGMAFVYRAQALKAKRLNDYKLADSLLTEALAVTNNFSKENLWATWLYSDKILLETQRGAYPMKALEYCDSALSYALKLSPQQPRLLAGIHNNRAIAYQMQGNEKRAMEAYQQAVTISTTTLRDSLQRRDSIRLATALHNYVTSLTALHSNDSSAQIFSYLDKSHELYRRSPYSMAKVYDAKANLCMKLKNYSQSKLYYDSSLLAKQILNDQRGLARSYLNRASLFNELEEYSNALSELQLFEKIPAEYKELRIMADFNLLSAKTHNAIAEYKKAYSYLSAWGRINEELKNEENNRLIEASAVNQKNIEIARKELENKENQEKIKEVRFRNRILTISMIFIGTIILILYFFYRQKQALDRQKLKSLRDDVLIKASQAERIGQERTKKAIAEQLHNSMGYLFTLITNKYSTLSNQIDETAPKFKQEFASLGQLLSDSAQKNRKIAHELLPPSLLKVGLPAGIATLSDRTRESGLKVDLAIDGFEDRLNKEAELILFRAIEELLNNTLKYAQADRIEIILTEHYDSWNIMYMDNGKGFNYDPLDPHSGIGLHSIKSNIDYLSGTFAVDSHPSSGSTFTMDIPKNDQNLEVDVV